MYSLWLVSDLQDFDWEDIEGSISMNIDALETDPYLLIREQLKMWKSWTD